MKNEDFIMKYSDDIRGLIVIIFMGFIFIWCVFTIFTSPTRWQDKSANTLRNQGYIICEIKEKEKITITFAGITEDELDKYNDKKEDMISVMKIRVDGEISEVKIPVAQIKDLSRRKKK